MSERRKLQIASSLSPIASLRNKSLRTPLSERKQCPECTMLYFDQLHRDVSEQLGIIVVAALPSISGPCLEQITSCRGALRSKWGLKGFSLNVVPNGSLGRSVTAIRHRRTTRTFCTYVRGLVIGVIPFRLQVQCAGTS